MLLVTDQGTVPKGAQKTPGASQQGVKYKPIPTDPQGPSTSRGVRGPAGVSQTWGGWGKGRSWRSVGVQEAVVSGRGSTGASGHTLLMGRASWGLQINCSILDTGNGVTVFSEMTAGWEDLSSL